MSRRNKLIALAERVEALDGPDREVDAAIALATGQYVYEKRGRDRQEWFYSTTRSYERRSLYYGGTCCPLEEYTADMNAAMSLVPEGAFGGEIRWDAGGARAVVGFGGNPESQQGYAATRALALTAAALRALAEQEQ